MPVLNHIRLERESFIGQQVQFKERLQYNMIKVSKTINELSL